MIVLHSLPGAFGLSSVSPFCVKVEVYLRMIDVPFRSVLGDPRRAPKGKLPFVELDDGTVLADSGFIVDRFEAQRGERALDARLDGEQRARAHVVRRTFEESLYFALVYTRWEEDEGWAETQKLFAPMLPAPLRPLVPPLIRRSVRKSLRAQGIGRHPRDEVYAIGRRDLEALVTLLGDRPFFLGEEPTTVDATAYAFWKSLLAPPVPNPLNAHLKSEPRVAAYCERMEARFDLLSLPVVAAR